MVGTGMGGGVLSTVGAGKDISGPVSGMGMAMGVCGGVEAVMVRVAPIKRPYPLYSSAVTAR